MLNFCQAFTAFFLKPFSFRGSGVSQKYKHLNKLQLYALPQLFLREAMHRLFKRGYLGIKIAFLALGMGLKPECLGPASTIFGYKLIS